MDRDERLAHLSVPLYKLYYLDSLEGFVFSPEEAMRAVETSGVERVRRMVAALEWAYASPANEWALALPDTSHSPDAVRAYIDTTCRALQTALSRAPEGPGASD